MLATTNKTLRISTISLLMGLLPQVVVGTPPPFYQQRRAIEQIAKDTATPTKRAKVIAQLMAIVKDNASDIHLRQFSAEKLGELGAVEAEGMLKALAESLEWRDSTEQLKRCVTLAYWQITVVEEPTKEAQEALLIKLLFGRNHPPPHADVVPSWAVDELANRGVKQALPEIIKSIRYRNPTERGEERIRLCTTKIGLLTTSESRQEALTRALAMEDFTRYQDLKRWAIRELGKLGTPQSRSVLIGYALELQSRYYDKKGKWTGQKGDRLASNAGPFYRTIIETLKKSAITDSEIKAIGLRPDKFFLAPP